MDEIIDAIRKALDDQNYYGALFLTFMVPSICGSLSSQDGEDTKSKYISWFDRYVPNLFLKGTDCYNFRCSLLHQGRTSHHSASFSRVIFTIPSAHRNVFHNNILNDALNLDIPRFCAEVLHGVNMWLDDVNGQPDYERNRQNLIRLHPTGLAPYMVGMPLIS